MELILADKKGNDIKALTFSAADFDIGGENDFEITVALEDWQQDIDFGCRVYESSSECGGIINAVETDTAQKVIKIKGLTWRGLLANRIIVPPSGTDYRTVSGELNAVIDQIIGTMYDGVLRAASEDTGISVSNYQFDRYTTVLDGLTKMLKTKGYKLKISYVQGEAGAVGYVEISAVPIVDYSDRIELSQDDRLNFTIEVNKGSVNHLICLGEGELKNRQVIDLYLQQDGSIGREPFYFGINEITATYENANSEDLETDGIKHFQELISGVSLAMDVESLDIDVEIGDVIGGRDYTTGLSVKTALASKTLTFEAVKSVQYTLKE